MTDIRKPLPHLANEAEERKFWETHDSADYVDLAKAERVRFPKLRLSSDEMPSDEP
ncbi:MAG: CopG family antitoxin [Xanthobacteraceae bacterium]